MSDRIQKFIDSLDEKTRARLKQRLVRLREDPLGRSNDVKKLKGFSEDIYRLRVGDIRILYRLLDGGVEVVDIDYRGNVY